jgi:diguanylate cyclase (GGDEF)-like protein
LIGTRGELAQRQAYVGAIFALGALTLLWLGGLSPLLFKVGTVMLLLCLVPLAAGLRMSGGALLGFLFAILWIGARLGVTRVVEESLLFNEANIVAVLAMGAIGMLAGGFLTRPEPATAARPPGVIAPARPPGSAAPADGGFDEQDELIQRVLLAHREWASGWNPREEPWASFDNHVREMLRRMTNARRVRCYRVTAAGRTVALNAPEAGHADDPSQDALIQHVLSSGQSYIKYSSSTPPLVRTLADQEASTLVWACVVQDHEQRIGLFTAEGFDDPMPTEARLHLAADLIRELWLGVHHAEALRVAQLTDQASGVLNRAEFLSILPDVVDRSYAVHEPVVVLTLGVEGIRRLDDTGRWQARDAVIEAVGRLIHRRLRKEDIVGRFADDRFVALLRRLDLPLARLITEKLVESVAETATSIAPRGALKLRAGLAGSGLAAVPARDLLLSAFEALQQARRDQTTIVIQPESAEAEARI